jgi:hypothetical protein
MGQCLRGKMTEVGLIPAAPAPAVAEAEEPAPQEIAAVSEEAVPAEPALDVTPPADGAVDVDEVVAATFGLLRAEPDGSVVIAGSGRPGSKVVVYANGEQLGTVEVETSGDWVFVPDAPLPPGGLEITLGEEGKDGTAEDSFIVVINEDKTTQPLVVASKPGEASEVLQGLNAPTTVAAAPAEGPATPATAQAEPTAMAAAPDAAPETPAAEEPVAVAAATEAAAPEAPAEATMEVASAPDATPGEPAPEASVPAAPSDTPATETEAAPAEEPAAETAMASAETPAVEPAPAEPPRRLPTLRPPLTPSKSRPTAPSLPVQAPRVALFASMSTTHSSPTRRSRADAGWSRPVRS